MGWTMSTVGKTSRAARHSNARGGGQGIRFLRGLITHQGDDCVIYPLSRNLNGHGACAINGKRHLAHRLMCEMAYGPPPTPKHEAAHSCGRGHDGCVNPRHLSWKTRAENQADRYIHNRKPQRRYTRKLSNDQIDEIRALGGKKTNTEIAVMFGVTRQNIRQILLGQIWPPGKKRPREFTFEEASRICAMKGRKTLRELAQEYGADPGVIYRIQAGLAYTRKPA